MSFAERDDDDEHWLQEPKIDSPVKNWRGSSPKKKPKRRPLRTYKQEKKCYYCKQLAPVEVFRDSKCLACQAADYLGPI